MVERGQGTGQEGAGGREDRQEVRREESEQKEGETGGKRKPYHPERQATEMERVKIAQH